MKISFTEDGYLKIDVDEKQKVEFTQLQHMNALPYFMPSLKDRYEENSILYHLGEYIPVIQYLDGKKMEYEAYKGIVISILQKLLQLEKDGYRVENTCVSLDYLFIHPVNRGIRVIYIPVQYPLVEKQEQITKLLGELISRIQTTDCAYLLGTLVEISNTEDKSIELLLKRLNCVQEPNMKVQPSVQHPIQTKTIENRIEVPIEKIVYRSGNCKKLGAFVIGIEVVTGMVFPLLIHAVEHDTSYDLLYEIGLSVCAIVIFFIASITLTGSCMEGENLETNKFKKQGLQNNTEQRKLVSDTEGKILTAGNVKGQDVQPQSTTALGAQMTNSILVTQPVKDATNNKIQGYVTAINATNQARVSRNNNKNMEIYRENLWSDQNSEEWKEETVVLGNSRVTSKPYLIENGKSSLMDRIFIDKHEFIIGREKGVDYRIGDNSVSKKHARIITEGEMYYIEDMNSSNGTLVNNHRISDKRSIENGCQITIGNKIFIFYCK